MLDKKQILADIAEVFDYIGGEPLDFSRWAIEADQLEPYQIYATGKPIKALLRGLRGEPDPVELDKLGINRRQWVAANIIGLRYQMATLYRSLELAICSPSQK